MKNGVQYASFEVKRCPMFDPICAAKVAEHIAHFQVQPFSPAAAMALIEQKCGRYVRGKHKGELRGWATIKRCTVGGWMRYGPGECNGRVVYPGTLMSVSIGDDCTGKIYLTEEVV